jgi:uncharacterized circularly permuted ATP-grasp superfamily protein
MMGVDVPHSGVLTISAWHPHRSRARDAQGEGCVLRARKYNLRVPSGVSYMLEDRKMMMRLFPELFSQHRVAPVAHYPDLLLETLRASCPRHDEPDRSGIDAWHVQQRLF